MYQIPFDVLSGYLRTISTIVESAPVKPLQLPPINLPPDVGSIPHVVELLMVSGGWGVEKLMD